MVNKAAKVVSVLGSKGGVGATRFSLELARTMSEKGDVLLIDADADCCGDLAVTFNMLDDPKNIRDLLKNSISSSGFVSSYLNVEADNIGLIELGLHDEVTKDELVRALNVLIKCYDFIIMDLGSTIDHLTEGLFGVSHQLTILSGVDNSSLVAVKRIYSKLYSLQVDRSLIRLIVNNFQKIDLNPGLVRNLSGHSADFLLPEALTAYRETVMELDDNKHIICNGPKEAGKKDSFNDVYFKKRILTKLSSSKEIKKMVETNRVCSANKDVLEKKVKDAADEILSESDFRITDRENFIQDIVNEAVGMGPLEKFMKDPEVTEIMVNSQDEIYIEKRGVIVKSDETFINNKSLYTVIDRIVSPIGRRVDEASPVVDARLPDGSRVHVIIPPLSLEGPTITIRKFRRDTISIDDLISFGSLNNEMADFLRECVTKRLNILVSGGTGSGKTTLLNILTSFIYDSERIITVEDSAELKLLQPHVVRLESRPPNIEAKGEVTIRDLVKASLRMRPDRIIVGEVRSEEALDMLQAMNTGHDGSLTTIHANSCRDSLSRLETLVMFAGFDLPSKAIREQIASAIDIVVQLKRMRDGSRKIVAICEITGMEGETLTTQELFLYDDNEFISTGFRPKFN